MPGERIAAAEARIDLDEDEAAIGDLEGLQRQAADGAGKFPPDIEREGDQRLVADGDALEISPARVSSRSLGTAQRGTPSKST